MGFSPRADGRSGERGQGTIEYVGVLLVVAAIIGVVLGVIPSLKGEVRQGTICLVERALQMHDSCSASSPPPNELVCATSTKTDEATDQVSVLFLTAGNKHTLIETTYSNGEVQYTLVNGSSAEVQAKLFQAEGAVGDAGFDVDVSAAAGGLLQGSHTWTFATAKQAQAFSSQVNSSGGWGAVAHDLVGPVGGWALNLLGIHGAPNPNNLDPKNLTYAYNEQAVEGDLDGGANLGLGPTADAGLDATLQGAVGVREITTDNPTDVDSDGNVHKGDLQFFVNLNGDANGEVGATLFGGSGSGSADGTAVVTVSPSGQLLQVQVDASGQYTAGTGGVGDTKTQGDGDGDGNGDDSGDDGDGGEVGTALNLNQNDGQGLGYQYDGTINLQKNPEADQALYDMLDGNTGQGTSELMQDMNTEGTQRVQPYTVSKSASNAGLQLEIADIGGGVTAGTSTQNQNFSPGSIKTPGETWEKVICEK